MSLSVVISALMCGLKLVTPFLIVFAHSDEKHP